MSNRTIKVNDIEITILTSDEVDYISLTDMVAGREEGSKLIEKWLTNKNTIEYLGAWESLNNHNFNSPEFGGIRLESGTNRFFMSVKQWIEKTNAIGIQAKAGRYGGTYAHKDIALEFGMWIEPMFKLLILKEFQRLKEEESKTKSIDWDVRRYISKVNYRLQTDAVKAVLVPISNLPEDKKGIVYANEADLVYLAMFGFTSKEWKSQNQDLVLKGLNIRDVANTHQLIVLSNLESLDSVLIKNGVTDYKKRLAILRQEAIAQMKTLESSNEKEHTLIESPLAKKLGSSSGSLSNFNQNLKKAIGYNPKQNKE